jgi:hypothetical protein
MSKELLWANLTLLLPCSHTPTRPGMGQARPTPADIPRLMDLPATSDLGDMAAFSGGPPPSGSTLGTVPSRLLMQQLYDAGEAGQGNARSHVWDQDRRD